MHRFHCIKMEMIMDTGGTRDGGFDVGSRVDVPYLLHYGVTKLDYIFLSHAHEDHAAGTGGILKHLPVGAVVTAGEGREEYRKSMRISPEEMAKTTFTEALEGEVFEVDGVRIEVLYAPRFGEKGDGQRGFQRLPCELRQSVFFGDGGSRQGRGGKTAQKAFGYSLYRSEMRTSRFPNVHFGRVPSGSGSPMGGFLRGEGQHLRASSSGNGGKGGKSRDPDLPDG